MATTNVNLFTAAEERARLTAFSKKERLDDLLETILVQNQSYRALKRERLRVCQQRESGFSTYVRPHRIAADRERKDVKVSVL